MAEALLDCEAAPGLPRSSSRGTQGSQGTPRKSSGPGARPPLPEVPHSNSRGSVGSQGVRTLRDLTPQLIRAGLHEEYVLYRTRYLQWRQGGTWGAAGELGDLGSGQATGRPCEAWHPTPQRFEFFFTVSYWVAVSGIVSCMLLTFKDAATLLRQPAEPWHGRWFKVTDTIGCLFFTLMVYLQYVQLINVPETRERLAFVVPDKDLVLKSVNWESLAGHLIFGASILVFDVASAAQHFDLPGCQDLLLVRVPSAVGGLGFLLGAICEAVHNRQKTPRHVEWWASRLDLLAGLGFFAAGACAFSAGPAAALASRMCYLFGVALYLVSSVLLLVMWRGDDFGFLLLRQLNHAIMSGDTVGLAPVGGCQGGVRINHGNSSNFNTLRSATQDGAPAPRPARFSVRGTVFLIVYCWLFTCCVLRCTADIIVAEWNTYRNLLDVAMGVLWLLIVSIVLLVHSSVTSVPDQQPYRLGMMLMRATLSLAAVLQTSCVVGMLMGATATDE